VAKPSVYKITSKTSNKVIIQIRVCFNLFENIQKINMLASGSSSNKQKESRYFKLGDQILKMFVIILFENFHQPVGDFRLSCH
jgi:hypothetical protein